MPRVRAVEAMGLELWPDTEEHACNVVTAVTVPEGIDDELLRRRMVDQFGVLISGSLFNTPIYGKLVRIGHMGRTCSPSYALTAVTALGHCLRELGRDVDVGAGVEAFLAALDPCWRSPRELHRLPQGEVRLLRALLERLLAQQARTRAASWGLHHGRSRPRAMPSASSAARSAT